MCKLASSGVPYLESLRLGVQLVKCLRHLFVCLNAIESPFRNRQQLEHQKGGGFPPCFQDSQRFKIASSHCCEVCKQSGRSRDLRPIAHWNCTEQFSVVRLKYFKMLIWLEQSNNYTRTVASLIRLADNSGKSFASLSRFRCQKYVAYSSALGLVCALFFRVVWFRLSRPRSRDTS